MELQACWFWALVIVILGFLWCWTALRLRRATSGRDPAVSKGVLHSVELEDALTAACRLEIAQDVWDEQELACGMGVSLVMGADITRALTTLGWASEETQGRMHLTEAGKARAYELIRAHRLWEHYLVKRESMPPETAHAEAHRREHETTLEELTRLDEELGHPAWDYHGEVIPAPGSPVPSSSAQSLLQTPTLRGQLRITSLDDEPAALAAQLIALGLEPGVDIEIVGRTDSVLQVQLGETSIPLAAAAAGHIYALPAPLLPTRLSVLAVGKRARVIEISGSGKHQRRMLDMGFVPGAEVAAVRRAPLGDPTEYLIKGTAVALRANDADTVLVEEQSSE